MISTPSLLSSQEIIVSSQAVAGSVLHDPEALTRIAMDAIAGGATALRLASADTVRLASSRVSVPIIGLIKTERANFEPRITAISQEIHQLKEAGAGIVAIDATHRNRPEPLEDLFNTALSNELEIFADIANNAQGMVKALAIGFDQSKLVNRVTRIVASDFPHPLLDGKVDFNKDRIAGDSEMLISAKTLADSIRALTVGIAGRISRVQELGDLDEDVTQRTKKFLDSMHKAFADDFAKTPQDFRKTSLLSSGTMFRVLAGVWFELTSSTNAQGKSIKPRMSVEDATNFFKKLAPEMQIPIKPGNKWLTTGVFPSPAAGAVVTAPGSRNQELKKLTLEITNWALDSKSFPFN